MKLNLIITLIFIANIGTTNELMNSKPSTQETTNENPCEYGSFAVIKMAKPNESPNYFFRTFDKDGKEYVSYAGQNLKVLNLNSSTEHEFAGQYDPVPMGSDIMTTPIRGRNGDEIAFYSMDDIVSGVNPPKVIEIENNKTMFGVYQSVGKVSSNGRKSVYRLITDQNKIADYEITKERSGKVHGRLINGPLEICTNINYKLPMISKDGTMLSGYDTESGTSKIWKINTKTGNCDLLFDLGIPVGKADFSYDNKKIAFHTSSGDNLEYFSSPEGSSRNLTVYEYDFENKTIKKLTQTQDKINSYYPVYRPDGTIVYSQVDEIGGVNFIHADPKYVRAFSYDNDSLTAEKKLALFAIGQIWSKKCLNRYSSFSTSIATALSLSPEKCKQIVQNFWSESKSDILAHSRNSSFLRDSNQDISEDTLLAACPTENVAKITKTSLSNNLNVHVTPGMEVMGKKCSICHSSFNIINLAKNSLSSDLKRKIILRIFSMTDDKMPKIGTLSEKERDQIKSYLESIKNE